MHCLHSHISVILDALVACTVCRHKLHRDIPSFAVLEARSLAYPHLVGNNLVFRSHNPSLYTHSPLASRLPSPLRGRARERFRVFASVCPRLAGRFSSPSTIVSCPCRIQFYARPPRFAFLLVYVRFCLMLTRVLLFSDSGTDALLLSLSATRPPSSSPRQLDANTYHPKTSATDAQRPLRVFSRRITRVRAQFAFVVHRADPPCSSSFLDAVLRCGRARQRSRQRRAALSSNAARRRPSRPSTSTVLNEVRPRRRLVSSPTYCVWSDVPLTAPTLSSSVAYALHRTRLGPSSVGHCCLDAVPNPTRA